MFTSPFLIGLVVQDIDNDNNLSFFSNIFEIDVFPAPEGDDKTIQKFSPEGWFSDLSKVEPSIRIFGTKEQINKALNDYIEIKK